ncbi:Uncharacterised protein [Citrobacter koseri]|nr:Uncharacterised protein [Citrobacter koseri]
MENIALIGIDLGKNSFHIHCQDHRGKAVYRKKFTRPKLSNFWRHARQQPSRWKPVAVLTLWHASWQS